MFTLLLNDPALVVLLAGIFIGLCWAMGSWPQIKRS